ncbi:hypothetical protein M0R45_006416 [Rubus argutus]|uniref:Uncharacterized protein n=1 Tax=Rubus argutus TaxID=59490 RepID=A0AAW1YQW1_RUBAR
MMEELLPCKFYCVATALCVDDRSEVFQVLDMSCSRKWVSLDAPPVDMSKTYPWHNLCAAAAGTSPSMESLQGGDALLRCLSTRTRMDKIFFIFGSLLPFLLGTCPCFVEHQDHNGGSNYFLMFVLDGKEDTFRYKASLCLTQLIPFTPCTNLCHYQNYLSKLFMNLKKKELVIR